MAWLLLGVAAAESSLDKLARWQFEWHRTAEAEAQRAMATGLANSMLEEDVDPLKAGAFLDCQGDAFWRRFQQAFRRGGPLSPETSSLAYGKWKDWEEFIDGMDESQAFDGRVFVPLAGEWRLDGSAYVTRILEKRDWVTALQRSQWQQLFGHPPSYSDDNLVGFMVCPVGFAMVQYVIFLIHKLRSNLPEDAAKINLESMLFAFVSILDSNFDHLESSNWNVSSFDLAVNLNLEDPKFYLRYSDYIDTLELKLHLPRWQEDWPSYAQYAQGVKPSEPLRVALVGEHGPSNLENLAALQAALDVNLESQHFFTYMWQLKEKSSVRITWEAFWGEPLTESAGRDKTSGPLWTIDEAVYALGSFARRDLFLREVLREGLVICSEPLWLCVLLHAATQSRRQVTRASAAGRVMCFLVDFDQVFGLQEVQHLWALIPNFASSLISATSRITAEMIHWQTTLRVPYVPCVSLHVMARHEPRKARAELLFFRSSLPGASPFLRVLRLLEAELGQEKAWPVVAMTKSLSFQEIAEFQAVAMLPHIPNALRLSDVYAMHVPIFIPDEPLIHKFLWPDDPLPLLSKAKMTNETSSLSTLSPLDFQEAGRRFYKFRAHRHYWLQYTEWWLRPHLQRFSSARQLLTPLAGAAALELRDAMAREHRRLTADVLDFWRCSSAAALL